MTPTKITLEKIQTPVGHCVQLKVTAPDTLKGYVVIEGSAFVTGKSVEGMRKHALRYAKQFSIPFVDLVGG